MRCFVCSNSKSLHRRRHYWVVEFENGAPKYAFDSLQGKQRLTQELAKKLRVFGVLFNVEDEHVPFLRTKQLDEAAGIIPAVTRGWNPILAIRRGRIQWARNFLCKKHAASSSKKGRTRKHTLKSSSQQRLSGKQDKNMPSKGLLRGKQKVAGNHKPRLSKPGRGLPNVTRKTLPWLFSQASGAHDSQGHDPNINNGCVFDISDNSLSEGPPDTDISGLNNEVPLSDPISECFPLQGFSKAGDDRANRNRTADVSQIAVASRISRDPLRLHDVNSLALSNGLSL